MVSEKCTFVAFVVYLVSVHSTFEKSESTSKLEEEKTQTNAMYHWYIHNMRKSITGRQMSLSPICIVLLAGQKSPNTGDRLSIFY